MLHSAARDRALSYMIEPFYLQELFSAEWVQLGVLFLPEFKGHLYSIEF